MHCVVKVFFILPRNPITHASRNAHPTSMETVRGPKSNAKLPSSSVNHIYANYMINEQTVDLPMGKNARERDRFMSQFFISFFMFGMHTQQSARLIESA